MWIRAYVRALPFNSINWYEILLKKSEFWFFQYIHVHASLSYIFIARSVYWIFFNVNFYAFPLNYANISSNELQATFAGNKLRTANGTFIWTSIRTNFLTHYDFHIDTFCSSNCVLIADFMYVCVYFLHEAWWWRRRYSVTIERKIINRDTPEMCLMIIHFLYIRAE